jgi:hypothetical protein
MTGTYRQIPDWLIRRDGVTLSSVELDAFLILASFQGANDHCYPSIPEVAEKLGRGERQTERILSALVERGYVARSRPQRRGPYDYDVRPLLSGDARDAPDPTPVSARPDTHVGPDPTPTSGPKEKHQGKAPKDLQDARPARRAGEDDQGSSSSVREEFAEALLGYYNSTSGHRRLTFRRADGSLTRDGETVVAAVAAHPDLDRAGWRRALDWRVANPWATDGRVHAGLAFAPHPLQIAIDRSAEDAQGGLPRMGDAWDGRPTTVEAIMAADAAQRAVIEACREQRERAWAARSAASADATLPAAAHPV